MNMTEEEIRRNYRLSKAKKKQIGILADLNCCSKDEIRNILGIRQEQRGKRGGKTEPLSDRDKRDIIRMHRDGAAVADIVESSGRSPFAVRKTIRQYEEGKMIFTEEQTAEQSEELLKELTQLTEGGEASRSDKPSASQIAGALMDMLFGEFSDLIIEIKANADSYIVRVASENEEVQIRRMNRT